MAIWRRYLLVGLAVSALCVALPLGVGRDIVNSLIGFSGAAAILVGVRRNRPTHASAWYLFAAGTATWAFADGLYGSYEHVQLIAPVPSLADVFYLAAYPLFATGLLVLGRARRPKQGPNGLDETLILTVCVGLLAWVFLITPTWTAYEEPLVNRLVGIAYPICDLLLFAVLMQLATSGAARNTTFRLVAGSVGAMLAADAVFAAGAFVPAIAAHTYLLDVGWLLSYVLWGAAALHPSMRDLSVWQPPRTLRFSPVRLVMLAVAVSIGPVIAGGELIAGRPLDAGPIVIAGGATVALVITRIGRIMRLLQDQTDRLARLADTDYVTGLANRRHFVDRLDRLLGVAHPEATGFLLIDLARFSEINDTLGNHTADAILHAVGVRLGELSGEGALVARMGTDTFGILDSSITSVEEAGRAAVRIREALEHPLELSDLTVSIEARVGSLVLPEDGSEPAMALMRADMALSVAKGRSGHTASYGVDLESGDMLPPLLIGELGQAIVSGDIIVYYQPQVEIHTGRVYGVEALARWQHPRHGLLGPDLFIPMAEQAGLIGPLLQHVLDSALLQCARWQHEGLDLTVAVNLSVRNLLDPGLVDDMWSALQRHGLQPSSLELEITEGTAMVDPRRSIQVLGALAQMGVLLTIDDYGTGHSSLAYLQQLPVGRLKIDRSFVTEMTVDDASAAIVRSTIELARVLRFDVVAEGVEDDATLVRLRDMQCYAAQGFGLGRPVAAPLIPHLVRQIEERLLVVLGTPRLSQARPGG
jgi:diguanylate cyclase (GGDEF)-like protein